MNRQIASDRDYKQWITGLKGKIRATQGNAIDNFPSTLPGPQAKLARETLKKPYNFDFLPLGKEVQERTQATEFKREYAGKLNFYVNVVNAQLKRTHDKPSIGILLCKTPNKVVVEFSELPSIKDLEKELKKVQDG